MRKFFVFAIFSLLFTITVDAQIKKILHKTYEIDEVAELSFDIVGEYEVIPWAGSTVLIETTVELYDAGLNIYKHLLKVGRYQIDLNLAESSAAFISHDKVRKEIKTSTGQCWEIVKYKIRIPEEFDIVDQTRMIRQTTTETVSKDTN